MRIAALFGWQELARLGVRSVVFDTGEHGPGGRLATRATSDNSLRKAWVPEAALGSNAMFDHAAQCFTAADPRHVLLYVAVGLWPCRLSSVLGCVCAVDVQSCISV